MTRASRIVFFGVVPAMAVAMAGASVAVSDVEPERALLAWGPREWAEGLRVPLRLAVFRGEEGTEPIRKLTIRTVGERRRRLVAMRSDPDPHCECLNVHFSAARGLGRAYEVELRATTAGGDVTARVEVRRAPAPPRDPRFERERVRGTQAGPVRVDGFPAGGALSAVDPVPVYLRFLAATGRPWSGRAGLVVRVGAVRTPAPRSIEVGPAGVAELVLEPLLTDLHVEVSPEGLPPARLVLPVRPARPTIHVADPGATMPGAEIEVRSRSGARCAYLDTLVAGVRRHVDSAPLRQGRATFVLPDGLAGVVALQASTHFAEHGDAVTVRHVWVGPPADGPPEVARARLAELDAVRYPPPLLVDGGEAAGSSLRARRASVRGRAVAGIVLCFVAELVFLGRVALSARRRAREIEQEAARETHSPPPRRGSDALEVASFVAASAAGFAALAAVAGLL